MISSKQKDLYAEVIEIATDYLGPASKRFIDRQIINHLQKEPEKLTKNDLNRLIGWIEVVVALLTEDKKLIQEFTSRLEALAKHKKS
jgi:hypothetical protein